MKDNAITKLTEKERLEILEKFKNDPVELIPLGLSDDALLDIQRIVLKKK